MKNGYKESERHSRRITDKQSKNTELLELMDDITDEAAHL